MKKTIKFFFILVLNLANSFICFSQLEQTKEILLLQNDNLEQETKVINLKNKGILILSLSSTIFGKKYNTNIIRYDSTFKELWQSNFEPSNLFLFNKYYVNDEHLYCLYQETDKQNLKIVKIDLETGFGIITETKMLTKMEITHFAAIDNKILIGGIYNKWPVVELCKLFDKTSKVLPNLHVNNLQINNIDVDESSKRIFVMASDDRKCTFSLYIFDYDGKLILSQKLGEKNKVILSGELVKLPDNKLLLAGDFGDNCTNFSTGLYLKFIDSNQPTNYYKFSDLTNFYSFMSEKRREKVKTRNQNKINKGKEIKIRYKFNLHKPILENNEIQLIGEVYYPEYKANQYGFRSYPNTLSSEKNVYEAYSFKFTHSIICTFDFNANLIWNNTVNLKNYENKSFSSKTLVTKQDENYLIIYPSSEILNVNKLNSSLKSLQFSVFNPKNPLNSDDTIIYDIDSELSSWYANNYLMFGYKTLKSEFGINNKYYFFVNKLTYKELKQEK